MTIPAGYITPEQAKAELDDYIERLGAELKERGELYEKYGSGIRDQLKPLIWLTTTARDDYPYLLHDFLKEYFA